VALHLAASFDDGLAAGLATLGLLESPLTTPGFPIKDGRMALPDAPGLGVNIDEAALTKYTVREWRFEA
jgi:L-alanine-DL-glutamate epimerase-like enolase superfamily enzyme